MKLAATLALVLAALPAAAKADITELRAERSGDTARVLIIFDAQPTLATASLTGDTVRLMTRGASAQTGEITPPDDSPVAAIQILAGPDFNISFRGQPGAPQAELYENAILLTVTLSGAEAAMQSAEAESGEPDMAQNTAPHDGPIRLTMDPIPDSDDETDETVMAESGNAEDMAGTAPGQTPDAAPPMQTASPTSGDTPAGPAISLLAARLDDAACIRAEQMAASDAWAMQAVMRAAACKARDGETGQARELYQRILTFDPYSAEAVTGLGALAQDAGRNDEARQKYEQALDMSPGDGLAALIRQLEASL